MRDWREALEADQTQQARGSARAGGRRVQVCDSVRSLARRLWLASAAVEFGILGALEVRRDGGPLVIGGEKPRALLAMLLLHANEPVSPERLALALWGEEAPPNAVRTLQVHLSRLRSALGAEASIAR